ncbi:Pimeloyl-ACP methyl ester carboxylesterase [Maribacter sedimenticola]|uniref:Pimeloyl-ACP methyl ester carboxylesterase n=1 Tax=Maribacter sedimenticola TaxID=228956 RepID=A0ABY1SDM9_9FLAO|nr:MULTISPECIES: alpha/beta fold hydrolase [Maribacter]TVZ16782.1 pimeloyl-ACP methyl ester carboxylesterase [Maribacter sp. MAR_2009_72]SNR29198.1 Pimeloyl-ACP methyl ester carboxylesterase [Maribacter sedimenticola]
MTQLLNSVILGEGSPLCILHGFLGMLDNWKTLGNSFAENGFHVHLIDQRNHGKSFHSPDFNYDILSNDLLNYLNHHNIDKTNIIGHSMGGKTAMQFACSHPERMEKLIVADIAPKFYPPHHQDIINALNAIDTTNLKSRRDADDQLKKHIPNPGIRQFLLKNLDRDDTKKLCFKFNLAVLSEKMEEIGDNINSTDSFNGPTLFLRGDRSEYVTNTDTEIIQQHFPMATIDTIENAGHWLHAENPTQFLNKSLVFFNKE